MGLSLPIHEALPDLTAALRETNTAVLVAPPGAGKTTVTPLALLDEPWVAGGKLLVLEPRRLAAKAAAARMADTLGEEVGATVGFRVRLESRVSRATRIEVLTEGVFTRMILDDPGLEGVAAVLFDEFHERSLDADLGLALARDAQGVLRDDLRILVMSATLEGARIAARLGEARLIESEGKAYPVETRYLGREPGQRIEDQVARAVRLALAETRGDVLAFLPGQAEIRRTVEQLEGRLPRDVDLAPLYGALDRRAQDAAIRPSQEGRRKVVLATAIAETSLTIEGVRVVVDSGLSRVPRFDPASGLTRLRTERVTRAAADQRRGRAGRTAPGVCYRLWDEAETRALAPFGRPEILEADLSGLVLDLAAWGVRDVRDLAFLDPPPEPALSEARRLLGGLQALDAQGALTAHGREMARLPLPPRLAHMLLAAAKAGAGAAAARVAVLLTEQGLGGTSVDLGERLSAWGRDRSPRARDAEALARRWASLARGQPGPGHKGSAISLGRLLAEAYPERIARARGAPGEFRLTSGRGAFIDPGERLARATWLAVAELGGGGTRDRITLAAEIDEAELLAAFADRVETTDALETDAAGRVKAWRTRRLGALVLERREQPVSPELIVAALMDRVRAEGLSALPPSEAGEQLRARVAFLRSLDPDAWPDLSDAALVARLDEWLPPLLAGRTALAHIPPDAVADAIRCLLPWERQRDLDRLAPPRFATPAGTSASIDYRAEGGPRAEVRVQELFGLAEHPMLAEGRAPLTLSLLSPARRPVQVTRDLPGFWRGSWREVRTEMRGRYPRHVWPEDPLAALPTTRAKPRGS